MTNDQKIKNKTYREWNDRINNSNLILRFFWSSVYFLVRILSFSRWNPLKQENKPQEAVFVEPQKATLVEQQGSSLDIIEALVVGGGQEELCQNGRWGSFFQHKRCIGLSEYIKTDIIFDGDKLFESPKSILAELLDSYREIYLDFIRKNQPVKTIIFDRAMQGLVISAPFGPSGSYNSKDKNIAAASWVRNGYFGYNNSLNGSFQQHVFCLLLLHLTTLLIAPAGKLIVDTQFLDDKHLALLREYFSNISIWDYNDEKNSQLKYDDCYLNNNHGKPKFMEFSGYNGKSLDYDTTKNELLRLSFPLEPNENAIITPRLV